MASLAAAAGTAAFTRSSSSYYGGMHCRACMIKTDHYSILGVRRNASKTEIKRAYRRLVRQFHPDVCKDRASEQKFVQINSAYESIIKKESCFQSEMGLDYSGDDLFQMEVVPDIFYTNEWFEGLDFNNIPFLHYTVVPESMDEKIFTAESEGCQTSRSEDAIPWMQS